MPTLRPVKCGWKWLERTLNELVTAINQNTPLEGAGIHTAVSPGGTSISAQVKIESSDVPPISSGSATGPTPDPNGNECGWQLVQTIDANCNPMNQYFWGGPPFIPGTTTPNP